MVGSATQRIMASFFNTRHSCGSAVWLKVIGITLFLLVVMVHLRQRSTYSRESKSDKEISGQREQVDGLVSDSETDEWKPVVLPSHFLNASYDDPDLLEHIKEHWILHPPDNPLRLEHPERTHYSQAGQSELVNNLLKNKRNGFFIECGAGYGEALSNTLFFEKSMNWTGLLIEANPTIFSSLRKTNRHAYLLNACVSPTGRVGMLKFAIGKLMGGLTDYMEASHKRLIFRKKKVSGFVQVPCFPIGSLLRSVGVSHVDYFSLDVEGPEMDILKTFPFDDVTVEVFTVEYGVNGCPSCRERKLKQLRQFFKQLGNYREVQTIGTLDVVFQRKTN